MSRIDEQMLQIYNQGTKSSSASGKQITEDEARLLIKRAQEINTTHHSSFKAESNKGNKYLSRLMDKHGANFSSASQKMINQYIEKGQIPSSSSARSGHDHGGSHGAHSNPLLPPSVSGSPRPSAPSSHGHTSSPTSAPSSHGRPSSTTTTSPSSAGRPVSNRPGANPTTSGAPAGAGSSRPAEPVGARPAGGTSGSGAVPAAPTAPTPTAPTAPAGGSTVVAPVTPPVSDSTGTVGPYGKVILDFQARHKTFAFHWFPMKETKPGGDPINNLYAPGGCLEKHDLCTGKRSRQHEIAANRKPYESGKEFDWWGHCNNASEGACIFQQPKHSVVRKAKDGTKVEYTTNDIQGLLVKVSPSLIDRVDFKGQRYDSKIRDNPNDPAPEVFLKVLKEWSADGMPFVLDIDPTEQVWNYPYDKAKVQESDKAPQGFDASGLPQDGSVKYSY